MHFDIVARLLVAVACLAAAPALPADVAQKKVEITDAWARATVAGQNVGGVYMDIRSATPARLVSISSPAAGKAEIHSMTVENGVMKMLSVDGLALPAGQSVKLAPGGFHVMLIDLKRELKQGNKVPLVLTIESPDKSRQSIKVAAEIRDVTGAQKGH